MIGLTSSTLVTNQLDDSLYLSRTFGPITTNPSAKRASSLVSKTCKEASALFLTRRLPEALEALETVITPFGAPSGSRNDESIAAPALIVNAHRSLRVKVWNLYLTLLNAVIELGFEGGKASFGSKEWRSLVAKAREGTIWAEVVNIGYGGIEGNVDADVVANLATLLLAHSPSQSLTQSHLETYLSAACHSNLDLSDRSGLPSEHIYGIAPHSARTYMTDTPCDLDSRIKILELYTLHVLPRNEEWQYAKDFIAVNEILDEERKEAFLQFLQSLEEQKSLDEHQESELVQQREERERKRSQTQIRAKAETRLGIAKAKPEMHNKGHKISYSEQDYGVDDPPPISTLKRSPGPNNLKPARPLPSGNRLSPSSRAHAPSKKPNPRKPSMRAVLQQLVLSMTHSVSKNPTIILRTVFFIIALIAAVGRREVRDRVGRLTGLGLDKIKDTIGMGVKVSYL
ncbi:hypothetical protein MMC13_006861 [Lambiella insularis]|nr:hypothetical protein [Lambiella insularis]